jgi:hypothetical protein
VYSPGSSMIPTLHHSTDNHPAVIPSERR